MSNQMLIDVLLDGQCPFCGALSDEECEPECEGLIENLLEEEE